MKIFVCSCLDDTNKGGYAAGMVSNVGTDGPRRVWILGAGFSRSLGGPLMGDLLSLAARRLILSRYHEAISQNEADLVFWLYHFGNGFRDGPFDPAINISGENRWRDAEHFLEILDSSNNDEAKALLVRDAFDAMKRRASLVAYDKAWKFYPGAFERESLPEPERLSIIAKRIVAASCCVFLNGVTSENIQHREPWAPYRQWVRRLRAYDTVVTFNYDLVVETLRFGSANNARMVAVDLPGEPYVPHDSPRLLKLHGSVGWKLVGNSVVDVDPWSPSILGEDSVLAIATPGDSKMQMAKSAFGDLWKTAEAALREATDVFVIGFRFPQSDAFPRSRLLAALYENKSARLGVHVVLGPEHSSDRQRVLSLLQWTVGVNAQIDALDYNIEEQTYQSRSLTAYSMYAEDFLDTWARREGDRLRSARR